VVNWRNVIQENKDEEPEVEIKDRQLETREKRLE
jgi:hypothetical protein